MFYQSFVMFVILEYLGLEETLFGLAFAGSLTKTVRRLLKKIVNAEKEDRNINKAQMCAVSNSHTDAVIVFARRVFI